MDDKAKRQEGATAPARPMAAFGHLTGPSQGTITWMGEDDLSVTLGSDCLVHVSSRPVAGGDLIAHLRRTADGFDLEAVDGRPIWVNGQQIRSHRLKHHDVVEFCEPGPMSRFYLFRDTEPRRLTMADVLSDAAAYLRSSRQPGLKRVARASGQVLHRLARETTILFRIGVILALAVLAGIAYQQSRINKLLRQQLQTETAQIESFSRILASARKEALTPADLDTLRQQLEGRMATTTERVSELERLSKASARIIAQAHSSIVFVQGAYGFRETATGRMLRHVIGDDGKPLTGPSGIPLLSLEGNGPVAERQFTGTAFVIDNNGALVTNRHVGLPWTDDVNVEALAGRGLTPQMIKLIGYLPGVAESDPVELVRSSDRADLAVLRFTVPKPGLKGLKLADKPAGPGDDVIVMGYPTGMRAMLAQAGKEFIKELAASEHIDFWIIAARLAEAGHITPLASRGIIGRATEDIIVYDAETTSGGSGGPVLDINGDVVAVNAAILAGYAGSNMGVPVARLRQLLDEAQLN